MEAAEELPKTSQPAIGQFVELYEKLTADGSEVISIHLTGGMSGTVQTAESASKMVDGNITVIDSNFISYGLGFQVSKAAELAKMVQAVKTSSKKWIKSVLKQSYLSQSIH